MDKRLIMAVAGSGKTYLICNSIDSEKRNLILAFTHENIKNIHHELLERFGAIPENTIVSTFHSFLFSECIRPYHRIICGLYGEQPSKCEGVMFVPPPRPFINRKYNPNYVKDSKLKHYIPQKKYYCSLMAKLILKNSDALVPTVLNRINKFYDFIFIDEYQDYRNNEYEFLSAIIQGFTGEVFLVGDYYQHSVSGDNNTGKPFGTANRPKTYQEYKKLIERLGVSVDEKTLCKSRRCAKAVCNFVKSKIDIEIESSDGHAGRIIKVSNAEEAENILIDDSICKLLLKNSGKYRFKCCNWSYSKGNTYERTCVILTGDTSNLMSDGFQNNDVAPITRNKLYVALTRSQTDVYLMPKKIFDEVKSKFLK